jgi:hypothetical protein
MFNEGEIYNELGMFEYDGGVYEDRLRSGRPVV